MTNAASGCLLKLLHALLTCMIWGVILGTLILGILAYGLPGSWAQETIDRAIPAEVGRLTLGQIAFRPGQGLILNDLRFTRAHDGKRLVSFSRAAIDFSLFARGGLAERLRRVTVHDLFVAQIEHDPEAEPATSPSEGRHPFPTFSDWELPRLHNVKLAFYRPDVLEVQLREAFATLDTRGGAFCFTDIRGTVVRDDETAQGDVTVDMHAGTVSANLRGFLIQTRINGIYRALDFPVIEKYSNKFTLRAPAYVDCSFIVGFDKYRNIFDLRTEIASRDGGAYCGVPFDEATGTIRCRGIWDAVTEITDITAYRQGKVVARGDLRFDCPNDRFSFRAEGEGLSPSEALRLIDMPFTQAIPEITCTRPPTLSLEGNIPLLTEQTPARVKLTGSAKMSGGGAFEHIPVAALETDFAMTSGIFSLTNLRATLPSGGNLSGIVNIAVPESAEYTDITAKVGASHAALADLLSPFGLDTLTDSLVNGDLFLTCRTDETFKRSLTGELDLVVDGGLIGRIPLFAGLTDIIAENVPGVTALTDTSTATLQGTLKGGLLSIPHFTLTGDLFSIEGPLTYNLPEDQLDAFVIAGVFKPETLVGTLTRWATVPFTRLAWQIHVNGPLANPDWRILTLVDKLWDKVKAIP